MPDYSKRSRLNKNKRETQKLFLLNRLVKYVFFAILSLVVLIPLLFLWYSRDLPTPGKLVVSKYKDATRIYDRKGELLYSVYQNENRTYVPLKNISPLLQKATIAIEDKNFYKNSGFSITGYLRAIRNILFFRGISGGSTITQQLVKNVLLTPERSIPRKIKELILSIQVDKRYSKDQILEMYLNNISYGGAAIGVEAASETYFGKKAGELDLAQAAFLAGLPQSPSLYSPFGGQKYYLDRTQAVLTQMVKNGYTSQKDADQAFAELKAYKFAQKETAGIKAPHFVMYIKNLLAKQFGEQVVDTGGLQVTTTLDYKIEQKAEQIVKDEIGKLKGYHVTNGAAMVTDPKTGEILAMVGSKDYFDKKNNGNFNVALSPNRQPGSSLKPIMYAVSFEKGYTPATMVMDVKTDFPTGPGQPMYSPVNYDGRYRGPVQIRFALGNSLNVPAVKMLARVGIQPVMQKAYEMGIENWKPTPANMAGVGLSLVLGGRETSLYDEMTAYGAFATEGIRHDLNGILKVTDSKGKVLYEAQKSQGQRVLGQDVSFLISHILLDNNARTMEFGPNSYLVVPGKTVSVKTGTTDEKRDNWTIGYTPSYVVGVWVGNNDYSPMNQAISSGVTGASPIWNKIMSFVLQGKPDEYPKKPDNVMAMQIDALGGGLPHGGQPTRSEYFIKGTEPTAESPIYKSKDGKNYLVFYEDDPVSKDGVNRWEQGILAWIEQNHKDDPLYHPPADLLPKQDNVTPTPTLTPSPTP